MPAGSSQPRRVRLSPTIIALGFTSLFTDVGTEMVFPLLPLFLTETLRAGPGFLGLVEGIADTVASLLKLLSGQLADRMRRRKPLVLFGYGLSGAIRPFMAAAATPWHVLAVRITDRIGKGVRSTPRDALIADAAGPNDAGRAFGFHQAMDHAGAVLGPLLATGLLAMGLSLRTVFWLAAVPGALAFVVLLTVREVRPPTGPVDTERAAIPAVSPAAAKPALPRSLYAYLGILLFFCLGNSSDAFLLLRAHELGLPNKSIPALWTLLNLAKVGSSYYAGALSDRVPRTWLILIGWVVYAAIYLGLGLAHGPLAVWILFFIYGLHYGLTEPAEKALVKDLAPVQLRGRAFGAYNFIVGVSALPASLLTGWLWRRYGAPIALAAGAGIAGISAVLLLAWTVAAHNGQESRTGPS